MKNIYLIGLMGCGKTSLGKDLSKALNLDFVDMDSYIVEKEKMSISDIFERSGEEGFRSIESLCLCEISNMSNCVVATGGGVILREENVIKMRDSGIVVFIDRPVELIMNDINVKKRPLLSEGKEKLLEIERNRRKKYIGAANFVFINKFTSPKTAAKELFLTLEEKFENY